MGKGRNRKPFIDKSKATTYNLLYRASEVTVEGEDASPERELVEASRGVGIGRPDAEAAAAANADGGGRYPPNHPLSMFQVFYCSIATSRACCTIGRVCNICQNYSSAEQHPNLLTRAAAYEFADPGC